MILHYTMSEYQTNATVMNLYFSWLWKGRRSGRLLETATVMYPGKRIRSASVIYIYIYIAESKLVAILVNIYIETNSRLAHKPRDHSKHC
jgi:hypothetical protein